MKYDCLSLIANVCLKCFLCERTMARYAYMSLTIASISYDLLKYVKCRYCYYALLVDTIKAWYNGALLIYVGHTKYIKKANEVKGNEMNSQNLVVCVDNSSKKVPLHIKWVGIKYAL